MKLMNLGLKCLSPILNLIGGNEGSYCGKETINELCVHGIVYFTFHFIALISHYLLIYKIQLYLFH